MQTNEKDTESASANSIAHTPGPWDVGNGSWVIAEHPAPGIRGSDDVEHYGGYLICESVSKSNARLIAAAPDLLEVAEMFIEAWDETWVDPDEMSHEWSDVYQRAKAIVRQAKGGHSA